MSKKRIYVIDDEPDTLTFLTTVLNDHDFQAVALRGGEEAVEAIEADPPDLVTLDITMPEKSGVSVYRFLKEQERYKEIPVIIITGISEDFRRFISTRRQVPPPDGYLSKPVEAAELTELVKKLLPEKKGHS